MNQKNRITDEAALILYSGGIPPWKVESYLSEKYNLLPPDNYCQAAIARRKFLEQKTSMKFKYLPLPEKPYLLNYHCDNCDINYQLAAYDENKTCSLCGQSLTLLEPQKQHQLTANYIGGVDDYYSFCGAIKVTGDIEKEFIGILQYGTGLGPIGVNRGAFLINRYGGAKVVITESTRACRNLGYIFIDEITRRKAMKTVESFLPAIRSQMNQLLKRWGAEVSFVEILPVENMGKPYLFIDFTADFKHFRGHGAISKAVGLAKKLLDEKLKAENIHYDLSGITQGYDGDLKPSPRNKRGRYSMAKTSIPASEIEKIIGKSADKFIDFINMDSKGTEKLGWFGHTGMGGEIIAGIYKAAKINPHAPLVSSTQKIFCFRENDNIVYGIELPNVEAGTFSSSEGAVPPLGREMMQFMGISNSREYAAYTAAFVLAGELNLSIEIVRENLYRSE
ncbi:MAG: hypothetical protein J7K40_06580 [candidate division Zixibacteria bacterium]|nr:hypothetical protein [candidate division Zixibacteria bacterium]